MAWRIRAIHWITFLNLAMTGLNLGISLAWLAR